MGIRYGHHQQQLEGEIRSNTNDYNSAEAQLRVELSSLNRAIDLKSQGTIDLNLKIRKLQNHSKDNQSEIDRLRKALADSESTNGIYRRKHLQLEEEADNISRIKKGNEGTSLKLQVELGNSSRESDEAKRRFLELEAKYDSLAELYENEKANGDLLSRTLSKKEDNLHQLKQTKSVVEKELDREMELHSAVSTDKRIIEEQLKKKELELAYSQKKINELHSLNEYKTAKEAELKGQLTSAEMNTLEYREHLRKLEQEKDMLARIADEHKKDAELTKKLRENELSNSIQLLTEKKRLENVIKDKELESSIAKRDLHMIQETHQEMIEDNFNKEREVEALKEHADVLSSQNKTVWQ